MLLEGDSDHSEVILNLENTVTISIGHEYSSWSLQITILAFFISKLPLKCYQIHDIHYPGIPLTLFVHNISKFDALKMD